MVEVLLDCLGNWSISWIVIGTG